MTNPFVSILMPAYNSANYIAEAVHSVLNQEYSNFELIIINDGSTDRTEEVIAAFSDTRIRYYGQTNRGVSAARNLALSKMQGVFFCFLDSDDRLPPKSVSSRVRVLVTKPEVDFVDGMVHRVNSDMRTVKSAWKPLWLGNPLEDLVSLSGKSFCGLTWMIRRKEGKIYRFREGLSHGEDLLFYLELAKENGLYIGLDEVVYEYRMHGLSAMRNIDGLARGYLEVEQIISTWSELSTEQLKKFRLKYRSFLWRSYMAQFQLRKALNYLIFK